MSKLVIVESPTKAKTIKKFLGKGYDVDSSFGHVRDLPEKKMGIDIEHDFTPEYVITPKAKKHVTELKKLAKDSDIVILATDEDREGEAIAWHLNEIFGLPDKKIQRIAFHEITEHAIREALEHPRKIDYNLVDAQQARRVLDRLVGYELSPFLWKKIARGLSAGRVQSVAVRLIVEREREIKTFNVEEYWSLKAEVSSKKDEANHFFAQLSKTGGKALGKMDLKNEEQVQEIVKKLNDASYKISNIEKKEITRNPLAPFTTSSLQQTANSQFGYSAKQIMMLAQQLYEGINLGSEGHVGLITYMRTDSVNLADKFINEAHAYIKDTLGEKYLAKGKRQFKNKSKNAQEAHEAIRPTDPTKSPDSIKEYLDPKQYKVYDLIWRRALASQMAPAIIESTTVEIEANDFGFKANGSIITFDGFLKIYKEKTEETILPKLEIGEILNFFGLTPEQHFTKPPARYSEATLIKKLEEYGIGRPSTYAPTIATIQDRNYIFKDENKRLAPNEIAFVVTDLLVKHFPHIIDYQFTAQLEEDLDDVAIGKKKWVPVISEFYKPFKKNLMAKYDEVDKKEITEEKSDEVCDKCGSPMIIKMGRYGKFLACSNYPECKNIKSMKKGANGEVKAEPEKTGEKCPECDSDLIKRKGRFGDFVGCSAYPKCKYIKKDANAVPETTDAVCDLCGAPMAVKRGRYGKFLGCTKYPECKNIKKMDKE